MTYRKIIAIKPHAAIALGLMAVASTSSYAATATDTFTVSVEVLSNCTVSATDLNFGTYDGTLNDATSTVSVNCTGQTAYTVELDGGEATNTAARVMTGDTHATTLSYQLYQDAGHTTVFGEGVDDVDQTGTGANQDITVYGRMVASQVLTEDTFDDVVTVTVTY